MHRGHAAGPAAHAHGHEVADRRRRRARPWRAAPADPARTPAAPRRPAPSETSSATRTVLGPPRLIRPPPPARAPSGGPRRGRCPGSSTTFTVGRQAALGQVVAGRGEVAGGGELQRAAVAQEHRALHQRLAERALADQGAALGVAQGAGDDLARAGAVAVDQHHQRQVARDRGRVGGVDVPRRVQPLGHHDGRAALQEDARDADGLADQAARVAAQVEHERLAPPSRAGR